MYLKRTYTYGNRKEIRKYHTYKFNCKEGKRSPRRRPTPEEMEKVNERNAVRKLKRLLINNFSHGDAHVVLTYRPAARPTVEESKKIIKKFMGRLRKVYRENGLELKWVMVTEWEGKSLHHHLALNYIDNMTKVLSDAWTWGGVHMTPLYPDYDYEGLAEYFVKETNETYRKKNNPYKQRWTCSRNLKRPEETVEIIKADSWRKEPKVPKELEAEGYVLDKQSVHVGTDAFGYPYQEYQFIKYDNRKRGAKGCRGDLTRA